MIRACQPARVVRVISWRLHRIKADRSAEERKLALTDQVSFVLTRPYYLTLIHSISRNVLPPFLFPFYLFQALRRSTDFAVSSLTYRLGPRGNRYTILSQSLSLARPAFFRKLSRSRSGGAIVQMLTRPELRDRLGYPPARYLRISATFAIGNFSPADEINRSRRLLRSAFDLSRVDRTSWSIISFIKNSWSPESRTFILTWELNRPVYSKIFFKYLSRRISILSRRKKIIWNCFYMYWGRHNKMLGDDN